MGRYRYSFILALAGLLIASFLAYEYNFTGPIPCLIGGGGCDVVRSSQYAKFLGVSVPYLGILYYLGVAFGSILCIQSESTVLKKLFQLFTFSGFIFSLYLTYLEGFVIKAYCFWCLISLLIATFIFLINVIKIKTIHENRD